VTIHLLDRGAGTQPAEAGISSLPLVSVGMPVFNGEKYLRRAIESILAQSYVNFELIICDNASTDRTQAICQEYAARDARVRYVRHPSNLGAGRNFDHCFHLARGKYFQWAAHDDMFVPDHLAHAVAALEARPEAVLCVGGIVEIGPDDEVIRTFSTDLNEMDAPSCVRRFACVIHTRHQCEDFFGVYRRSALLGTGLIGSYSGSDRVLLAEMALRGPWVRLPMPLFLHRDHAERATRALLLKDKVAALRWQDAATRVPRKAAHFHLTLYRHYWQVVRRSAPPGQRLGCYAHLLLWWFTDGHFADVLRDTLQSIDPKLLGAVRWLKRKLIGRQTALPPGSLPELKS
jgi:glycosyltransferase involved in cell wall biosynthesis